MSIGDAIKGPGGRDQGSGVNVPFCVGCHTRSNSFTTLNTKRRVLRGQGPGLVNVLLAATHSDSFTTSGD